ncbi:hypothetical protein Ciccas_010460 [Cichlidogyrus casuarinus]|uniref:Bifunctional lysine-specific demethylase and histidyl-hydroxylase n=1 Tax=Cichlidogyrus casuarinus TaxID=1844966 RepID=A0ABD2PU12_9PLAT
MTKFSGSSNITNGNGKKKNKKKNKKNKNQTENGISHPKTPNEPIAIKRPADKDEHQVPSKRVKENGHVPDLIEDTDEQSFEEEITDPMILASNFMEEILEPVGIQPFFSNYFENRIYYSPNKSGRDFTSLFSSTILDTVLTHERVMYGEHLDITQYVNGVRETLNPDGRAFRSSVWDHYTHGCSVRLLCPQVFYEPLQKTLNILQEFYGCFVGANVYLTPPNSQGFAPHWDDIDAFVLQVEGKKCWRVYKPRSEEEKLPFHSSRNFDQKEIGEPVFEKVLSPGDVLYFPRGYIHQAFTPENEPDTPSLHITLSTYQNFTWSDFTNRFLGLCLNQVSSRELSFREGLPLRILNNLGGSHFRSKNKTPESTAAEKQVRRRLVENLRNILSLLENENNKLGRQLMHDTADQMALDLVSNSLPPITNSMECPDESQLPAIPQIFESIEHDVCNGFGTVDEKLLPYYEGPADSDSEGDDVDQELSPEDEIRLVRWSCARVVVKQENNITANCKEEKDDEPDCVLTHCISNSKVYQEREPESVAIDKNHLAAWDHLVVTYPKLTKIEQLPIEDVTEQVRFATTLYEMGVIVIKRPGMNWSFAGDAFADYGSESEDEEDEGGPEDETGSEEEEEEEEELDSEDDDELSDSEINEFIQGEDSEDEESVDEPPKQIKQSFKSKNKKMGKKNKH